MCAVSVEPHILRTKLYAPRLPEIVARERLLKELERARSIKLAAIVAGAGYGKSTLAAEFLQRLGTPFVWYQLEETDSDLSEFLSYLVAGLRGIHPGFGERTLSLMASVASPREQSRSILSTLITELDELAGEDLFVALDDFHLVNESPAIIEAMTFLLGHMLPNFHFIILSRSALSLNLTELRARRELLELAEKDLLFSANETGELFMEIFNMPLSEQDLAVLSESTEGWIAGLVLFYLALKGGTGKRISAAIKEIKIPVSAISDYLANAVYENQSEKMRDFLTKTSILSRMNPAFCAELLGIADTKDLLRGLTEGRLFTIPLDDGGGWYRYHHCLSAFLQETLWKSCSPAEVRDLHLRAADLWERNGDLEQALSHYMEGERYERAAGVLEGIAGELMRANRVSFLDRELSRLPEDILQKHPRLMLYGTQIASLVGDYDRAVAAVRGAAEEFGKIGERDQQARSLLGLAEAHIVGGKFDEASEMNIKAREVMPGDSSYCYKALACEGMIEVLLGREGNADRPLEEAASHAPQVEGRGLRSTLLIWCGLASFLQGRLGKTIETLLDADRVPESAGLTHTHPYLYSVLSRSYTYLDRLEEAREMADKGVALGEKHGLVPMSLFSRTARAVALSYLGEREMALYDASIASSLCDNYGSFAEVLDTEWFLAEAYGLTGDSAAALNHWKRFEKIMEPYRDGGYLAQVGMVACSVRELGLEKATAEVQKIMDAMRESAKTIARSYAYSLLFSLKLAASKPDEAREVLETYIAHFGSDIILRTYTTDVEYLLLFFCDLFLEGEHLELMERVFSLGGTKSTPHLKRLEKSDNPSVATRARELLETVFREAIKPLEMRMLGPFRVNRGGQALTAGDWKSKKALTAFKYLAAHRQEGFIPREVLMELLWPESPAESAQRNLNAALTSMRKTLEPEASRGESSYLLSRGDALRLELGPGGWSDLELFRERLSQAAKAREIGDFDLYFRTLKEAADLYGGDFCSEDLYEDWCSQEREALKNDFMKILVNISTEHMRRGEDKEALEHLERAIAKDPGREELYRKQMTICSQAGNRAGVEEAFRSCTNYLWDAYEVAPSLETTELYQRLRKQ